VSSNIGPLGGYTLAEKLRELQADAAAFQEVELVYALDEYIAEAERLATEDGASRQLADFNDRLRSTLRDCGVVDGSGTRCSEAFLDSHNEEDLLALIESNLDGRREELDELHRAVREVCTELSVPAADTDLERAQRLAIMAADGEIVRAPDVDATDAWEAEVARLRAVLETLRTNIDKVLT
jgi:hypothetical protein